jgi:biopolymer transport protein ExbB/TolQ
MNSSHPNPHLPTWIFVLSDLALIGAGAAIATLSPHPLSVSAVLWIVACVGLGTLVLLVPLVARYERQKNETLDERQRALESLARTVASSAEQISIATNGFHEIAELAQKNLRLSEHLPHKLQDKIAEFQAQLAGAADAEKEELERELLALRTTESERLESVSQRIAKSAADWAKLEATTHQHLTAANEAVAKLAFGTAAAIGKAQVAAEQALNQARVEAARTVGESSGAATRAIETAKVAAVADLDARITTIAGTIAQRVMNDLTVKLAKLGTIGTPVENPPAASSAAAVPTTTPPATEPGIAALTGEQSLAKSDGAAPPPKRPRKVRREEPAAGGQAGPSGHEVVATPGGEGHPVAPGSHETSRSIPPLDEPQPIPAHKIPEITPVAPSTAEPFSGHIAATANGAAAPRNGVSGKQAAGPDESVKPPRKAPARPASVELDRGLGLELDDSATGSGSPGGERVLTSDGATRLLVTAYIGIGNRLFIRGSGPDLSWEKGVPLQFVSIGKWRWETNDATATVQFKVYKNDEVECVSLGTQSLEPGYQHEVTAAF